MKRTVQLVIATLTGLSLFGIAHAQRMSCLKDVTYSQEFLSKFPDAGANCQEVKVVNGEKWIRFNAEVKHNKNDRITVDVLNAEKRHFGDPLTFIYTPDATLTLVNKKVKAASAIEEGDEVVIWVPEHRFGIYALPGASESKQFKLVQN
ncbi:MAG: hypothetical protein JSR36_15160 [Proteobacteria bacterium]|nr:hypothetical protein [Pseudomonadota bacterium]